MVAENRKAITLIMTYLQTELRFAQSFRVAPFSHSGEVAILEVVSAYFL